MRRSKRSDVLSSMRLGLGCLVALCLVILQAVPVFGQGMGRITGGVGRLQAERGITGRFPSSRLTLEPEKYEGLVSLPFNLGRLDMHPFYTFGASYSDNIYLLPSNGPSDWAFDNAPGMILTLRGKQHLLEMNYVADIITNARFGDFDRGQHDFRTRLTVNPTRQLTLSAENEFGVDYITPYFIGMTSIMYFDNRSSVNASYDFGKKLTGQIGYTHEVVDFRHSDQRSSNFNLDGITLDLYYRVLPKTRVFTEFVTDFVKNQASFIDPLTGIKASTDNIRYQITGGLSWDPTAKLHGRFQGGYEWVVYDQIPTSPGPFFQGALEYDYSRRLRLGIRVLNTVTETSPAAGNFEAPNYASTNVGVRGSYKLTRNVDYHIEGFYVKDNFGFQKNEVAQGLRSTRDDTTVGFETGLSWDITRNVMVGISYQYQNNTSTGNTGVIAPVPSGPLNDFKENLVTLYLSLVF